MSGEKSPVVTVDGILERNGEIILIKRKNDPFKGFWALPGGFVEYGEKVEDALKRELKEETGIDIKIKEFHNIYSDPKRDPRGHIISLCYVAEGSGEILAGDDALEARFHKLGDALNLNLAFDHKTILTDYKKRRRHVL